MIIRRSGGIDARVSIGLATPDELGKMQVRPEGLSQLDIWHEGLSITIQKESNHFSPSYFGKGSYESQPESN